MFYVVQVIGQFLKQLVTIIVLKGGRV